MKNRQTMENKRKMDPKIFSAVDLTHLQPQERMSLIGNNNLKSRREFLEKLFKTGIIVGLPTILFSGCEPDIIYKATDEEDCPNYSPCNQHQSCTCQTDSLATMSPKVVNTVPAKDNMFTLDPEGVEIRIDIDKSIDLTSLTGALTITPEPVSGFDIHYYDLSKNNLNCKTALSLLKKNTTDKLELLSDTTYTVTLKGTMKDLSGKYLDGNGDGTGGDDFSFSFTTVKKYDSCICQNDLSCPSDRPCMGHSYCPTDTLPCLAYSCSCESNTCSCQGHSCFYCSCQDMGCITYGIYY